jgi:hypothetical protein
MTLIGNVITFFTLLMGAMVAVLVVGKSRYGKDKEIALQIRNTDVR